MKRHYNLSQIEEVATHILSDPQSKVFAFYGEMGVGKTTLIKELCKQLGVQEITQSPTFSIVNEYRGANDAVIYHFDGYRLERPEEILDVGFEEYVFQGDWIFIEWPEKIKEFLPENYLEVRLSLHKQDQRELLISYKC